MGSNLHRNTLTPRIRVEHVAEAKRVVDSLAFRDKEQLVDEIFKTQPNLLASVLVLTRKGVTNEDLDVLLNILFICYEAVRAAGIQIPQVSESVQELCLARIVGRSKFIEGLSSKMSAKATKQQIDEHDEKYLLAIVMAELKEHNLEAVKTEAEKYILLTALNLVETIAYVTKDA